MTVTKTAVVTNDLGDEMAVTINLRNQEAPEGTYNSVAVQQALRKGLPDVRPISIKWEPTKRDFGRK